eukprot:6904452-Pyramimonas_sp.AAC.1
MPLRYRVAVGDWIGMWPRSSQGPVGGHPEVWFGPLQGARTAPPLKCGPMARGSLRTPNRTMPQRSSSLPRGLVRRDRIRLVRYE